MCCLVSRRFCMRLKRYGCVCDLGTYYWHRNSRNTISGVQQIGHARWLGHRLPRSLQFYFLYHYCFRLIAGRRKSHSFVDVSEEVVHLDALGQHLRIVRRASLGNTSLIFNRSLNLKWPTDTDTHYLWFDILCHPAPNALKTDIPLTKQFS